MLVLSRKKDEQIEISGPATITVVEVDRGKVRLGFVAPRTTDIVRHDATVKEPSQPRHLAGLAEEELARLHGNVDAILRERDEAVERLAEAEQENGRLRSRIGELEEGIGAAASSVEAS